MSLSLDSISPLSGITIVRERADPSEQFLETMQKAERCFVRVTIDLIIGITVLTRIDLCCFGMDD